MDESHLIQEFNDNLKSRHFKLFIKRTIKIIMFKNYTLATFEFYIKKLMQKGFKGLKRLKAYHITKRIFYRLKKYYLDQKKSLNNSIFVFNSFKRSFRIKMFFMNIKNILEKVYKSKRIRSYDNIYRLKICKIIKKEFIKRCVRYSHIRHFQNTNNQIKRTRFYLLFFSKICTNLRLKQKLEIIYDNARTKYTEKIKKKALNGLTKYTEYSITKRSNEIRKKCIQKIFFKNLKEGIVFSIQNYLFYRKLHLKKYFINRWKRTIVNMKNYNLSRKKFLSKIIGSWRKVSFELKEKRYLNTSIFFQVLKNVDTSKIMQRKKDFLKKLNIYVLNLKLLQKNYEVAKNYEFRQNLKKKDQIFRILFYNKQLAKFERRKHYRIKGSILYILRNYRLFVLTKKINEKENQLKIHKFTKRRIFKKLKKALISIRESINKKVHVSDYFNLFIKKMKVFKLIRNHYISRISYSNELIHKFKLYYLKKKVFNLIVKNYIRKLREDSIICRLKTFYKCKRGRMLKIIIENWKRFFIIEKFRKIKAFQKKVKIFYILKFINKSKRIEKEGDYFEGKI